MLRRTVEQAYALSHPASARFSAVLDALLLCQDQDEAAIAALVKLPPEVVHAYGELFFNVRDRLDDGPYLASIVYPETRLEDLRSTKPKDESNFHQTLLKIGYESGAEEVMWVAGLVPGREREIRPGAAEEALQSIILDRANLIARHGRCEPKELMKHAAQFVARQPPKPPSTNERVSLECIAESMMNSVMETAGKSVADQMKAFERMQNPQEQPA